MFETLWFISCCHVLCGTSWHIVIYGHVLFLDYTPQSQTFMRTRGLSVDCVFPVTPWVKNPRFTYGLPEEHLRTGTKEWRYWIGGFSSARSPCIERDSGSSVGLFHVLKAPGEPCSTVGNPHFYLLLSCSECPATDPPLFVFVIVNN